MQGWKHALGRRAQIVIANPVCAASSLLTHPRWDHVRSTKVDQLLESHQHLSRTRPVLEDDLAAAIRALRESTATIEKHVNVLQRHQDYLLPDTLKRLPRRLERTALDLVDPSGRKDALELQQLRFAVSPTNLTRRYIIASNKVTNVTNDAARGRNRGFCVKSPVSLRRRLTRQEHDRRAFSPATTRR